MIQLHVGKGKEEGSSQESCQKHASRGGENSGCKRMSCSKRLWSLSEKTARHRLTSIYRKAVLLRLVVQMRLPLLKENKPESAFPAGQYRLLMLNS